MAKQRIRKAVTDRVQRWTDYERTAKTARSLKDLVQRLFVPQRKKQQESFSDAVLRLRLSERDIEHRMRSFKWFTIMMLMLSVLVVCYGVYQFTLGHHIAAGISLLMVGLPLMLAFRYHFWYFQLRQRKLGCSFKEWFFQGVLGHKLPVKQSSSE